MRLFVRGRENNDIILNAFLSHILNAKYFIVVLQENNLLYTLISVACLHARTLKFIMN